MPGEATSVREVFERHMPERLAAKPDLVVKINARYQFDISGPGGGSWSVDCTVPGGAVAEGKSERADCTVTCSGADFLGIVQGKLGAAHGLHDRQAQAAGRHGPRHEAAADTVRLAQRS